LSAVFILYPISDVVLLFFTKISGLGGYDGNDVCSTIFCLSFYSSSPARSSKRPNSGRLDVFLVCAVTGMNVWDLEEGRTCQGVYFGFYVNHEHTRLGIILGKDIIDTLGYF